MGLLNTCNPAAGPNQSLQSLIAHATSPDNVLFDVVANDFLASETGFRLGDGLVIDKGRNQPHTGGGIYMIRFLDDGYCCLRRMMALAQNRYFVATDYANESIAVDDAGFEVVGEVIGNISVHSRI